MVILGVLAAVFVPTANSQPIPVVVVPGLELRDLERLEERGAIGILVPAAGPRASGEAALAALERGKVRNSLRGGLPAGVRLVRAEFRDSVPQVGPAIVLSLPRGGDQPNDRRYPIAVIGDGYEGLLTSGSTRIPGLVAIADVAPTALGRAGALGFEREDEAASEALALDRRIRDHTRWQAAEVALAEALLLLLALVSPRGAVLGFASLLTANLALGALGTDEPVVVVTVLVLAVLGGGRLLADTVPAATGVAAAGLAVLVLYLAAFVIDQRWVALSPLGPSQNSRFYGISNLLETLALVPILAAVAILPRRPVLAALVAVVGLVVIAGNRFGADGGGALVLAVAVALLAALRFGAGRRAIAGAVAGAVGLVVALVALDAATGESTHVTRTLLGGPDDVAEALWDRVTLSYERATVHPYTIVAVTLGIALLALLALRLAELHADARDKALPLAVVGAIAVSLVVNDSPAEVIATGVVAFLVAEAYALGRESTAGAAVAQVRAALGDASS